MDVLKFTVDSALLRELGEKLVETVHLALIELVKNSYDADATIVEIIFSNDSNGNTQIKVIDNGIGMNMYAVKNFWMRIATANKTERTYSPVYGRPLTGAKGVGRFCCRRLGAHLTMITKGTPKGNSVGVQRTIEKTEVQFPWDEFEPGTDVTDIECEGEQINIKNDSTGTTLIISKISEEWNLRGFNWLKRQLAVLAANGGAKRDGFLEDPGFTIKLNAPDFEGEIRDVREDLMNAGWGTLTGHINSKHQAVFELDAIGIGKRKIISKIVFPNLNDIKLKIAIMVSDRIQMRDTSLISQGTLQKILPEWGGVQVRYKGFRVYPYGDDDWLDIDKDRGISKGGLNEELALFAQSLRGVDPTRALLTILSMKSYVGNAEIGEDSIGFEMKLNREGFISSKEFDQLKAFTRYAIDWSTVWRDYYLRQEIQKESLVAKSEFEDVIHQRLEAGKVIESAINYLETEVKSITANLETPDRLRYEDSFLKATEAIRKHNESNQSELSHLRIIASTSTLLLIFSHEVKSLLGLLEQSKNSILTIAKLLNARQKKSLTNIAGGFTDLKDRLEDLLELTSLIGTNQKKSKPGNISLKEKIIKVEKVFQLITKKYEINIDYRNVPNNIVLTKMLESEVYSILLNTISNSIKSVIAAGKNRKIEISAHKENGINIIGIRDTGLGLDPSKYDEVFIPFIADPEGKLYQSLEQRLNPEDKMIIGSGSGLGLGIVNEIIKAHDGTIKFKTPKQNWKSELEIKLQ